MLEPPAHLVSGQSAVSEFLLRDPDRFDVQDPVDDAEIVIDGADARFVLEIALAGVVHGLHDLLHDGVLLSRRLRGDRRVADRGLAGGKDILFGVRPHVPDDMVGREADLRGRLQGDRIYHSPAAKHDIIGLRAADCQPLRLLLDAGMRDFDLLNLEAVLLREKLIDRDRLLAVRGAMIQHDNLLALQLVETADLTGDVVHDA